MNNTKAHILKVTLKLFLQKGFKEVTLKDIVEETGLSKGAFYHYFSSKEQIFLELINKVFATVFDVPYEQFSKASLYHFYIDYINYYVAHLKQNDLNAHNQIDGQDITPSFNYVSLIFEAIKIVPDFQERLHESKEIQLNSWLKIIKEAREKGEIKSSMSDEHIANMFINSSDGVEMKNVYSGNNEDVGQTLLGLWDSFYQVLKG